MQQIFGRTDVEVLLLIKKNHLEIILNNIYVVKYHRDRYARFTPKNSRKYYLEDQINKNKSEFEHYFVYIDENVKKIVEKIGNKLVNY